MDLNPRYDCAYESDYLKTSEALKTKL